MLHVTGMESSTRAKSWSTVLGLYEGWLIHLLGEMLFSPLKISDG